MLVFPQQASAAEDLENCDRLFESLIRSVQERRGDVRAEIRSRQKEAERRAESLIGQLQRETAELQRRTAGLEELLDTEDHLHLLQVPLASEQQQQQQEKAKTSGFAPWG